jgi:hypothetical protein
MSKIRRIWILFLIVAILTSIAIAVTTHTYQYHGNKIQVELHMRDIEIKSSNNQIPIQIQIFSNWQFQLINGDKKLSSNLMIPPLGWDYKECYSINTTIDPGFWKIIQGNNSVFITLRSEAYIDLKTIPNNPNRIWERYSLCALIFFILMVLTNVILPDN